MRISKGTAARIQRQKSLLPRSTTASFVGPSSVSHFTGSRQQARACAETLRSMAARARRKGAAVVAGRRSIPERGAADERQNGLRTLCADDEAITIYCDKTARRRRRKNGGPICRYCSDDIQQRIKAAVYSRPADRKDYCARGGARRRRAPHTRPFAADSLLYARLLNFSPAAEAR